MKGLLLKDFYISLRVCWYFAIFIVFLPLPLIVGSSPISVVYACIVGSMLPASLHAFDERDKWLVYAETLPYTRKQIVTVKYIDSLISAGVMITISAASMMINTLFAHMNIVLTFAQIAYWCAVYLLVCAVISLINLPFVFWLGAERGRFVYILIGLICGITAALVTSTKENIDMVFPLYLSPNLTVIAVMIVVAVALYAASWALSIMLYRKREL